MIRTERSLVKGELSHHGKPFVPESSLASHSDMKPKLRGATAQDLAYAAELRHSLKDYSQDSILLMLAIVYADWKALQGTIAKQRAALASAAKSAPKTPAERALGKKVSATAPDFNPDILQHVRRKFQELTVHQKIGIDPVAK